MSYLQFILAVGDLVMDDSIPKSFGSYAKLREFFGGLPIEQLPPIELRTTPEKRDDEIDRILKEYSADTSIEIKKKRGLLWRLLNRNSPQYEATIIPVRLKYSQYRADDEDDDEDDICLPMSSPYSIFEGNGFWYD